MSVRPDVAASFFGPLRRRTTIMVLDDRDSNLTLAKVIADLLSRTGDRAGILDLDSLYSSNSDSVFGQIRPPHGQSIAIHIPSPETRMEEEFLAVFDDGLSVILIDSLNTLYHALPSNEGASRGRMLSYAVASLSAFAESSGSAVVLTMYRREKLGESGKGRPMSDLSDATVRVSYDSGPSISFICQRGVLWPGGTFSTRIP